MEIDPQNGTAAIRAPAIGAHPSWSGSRTTPIARHYGLDWLRIGAFLLLIVYHIGLYLSPWDWHVNTATAVEDMPYILMALNPWRMTLLFIVSGFAARAVLDRAESVGGFAVSRLKRLALPLLFGALLIVPPQPWVEVQDKLGYAHGYGHFLLYDYFGPRSELTVTPGLFHLWFLSYILAYSLIVAAAAAIIPSSWTDRLQRYFARLLGGWWIVVLPLAWLLVVREAIAPGLHPTNRLADDLPGHLIYLPAFLFGFGLARARSLWEDIVRAWPAALMLALAGYGATIWQLHGYPGMPTLNGQMRAELGWASLTGWGMILLLLAAAQCWLNRDHRWRAPLTEAVFPVYLVHQTLIVLIGWWLRPYTIGTPAETAILLAVTAAGCWAFYAAGSRIGWLRPWIGLGQARR